jgi:hypothetical protein
MSEHGAGKASVDDFKFWQWRMMEYEKIAENVKRKTMSRIESGNVN